ncbi:MAG TPA: sulfatase-like hydrolase/transferase [Gemmatimonadaceae bacterium]|nr:sulfatase-like hydrolase/transferase [Gemmatimonadaceae bacterium]
MPDESSVSVNRRDFLGLVAAGGGAMLLGGPPPAVASSVRQGTRPNIIYISADDLGYGDLSGYGRADFQTPVLDSLAAAGTRFTQAYSIAPICTPTRVGFMTGRYPARHPVGLREPLTLSAADRRVGLDPAQPTVSSLLRDAGYTNALFGKWHLGMRPEFHPNRHGFHEFFGPLTGAVDYVAHSDVMGAPDLYRNGELAQVEGYLTDVLADEAVKFIRARREPFFLSHQGTAPHAPWQRRGDAPMKTDAPVPGFNAGPGDRFPDMVRALDDAVGRILAAVADEGMADRTLIIFTSDNGGMQHSNMGGLARGKGHVWEGGIRVPAFARWPRVIPAGVTTTQVATTLDWSATILAAAGVSQPATHPFDGINLMPVLTGREPARERTVFWRLGQRARQGAVRQGAWKYLRDERGEYLFDLVLDPGERSDRKADDPARFKRLEAAYNAWEREMLPPAPLSGS